MKEVNVNRLGVLLDGWAELIDGRGAEADNVRTYIDQQLQAREMPQVATEQTSGYVNATEPKRPYLATSRYPGVTGTIYVNAHGEDLYVSWKTFQKAVPNWRRIGILILISLLVGIFSNAYGWFNLFGRSLLWLLWLAFFLISLVGLPYGAWRLYQRIKVSPSFLQQVNLTPTLDKVFTGIAIVVGLLATVILVNIIPSPPRLYLPSVSGLLRVSFWTFVGISIISTFVGVLRHGHPLAYFWAIPTIFDADDTLALSFSIHQAVLHALDKAGIDTTALHSRTSTTKGRLAEEI